LTEQSTWGDSNLDYFYKLTPEAIIKALESIGFKPTGRCLALNSMENRVYEIEIAPTDLGQGFEENFLVAKFYRPGRWSLEQIQEEHTFQFDLQEQEIPVITPLKRSGESVFKWEEGPLYYSVYRRQGGRPADELSDDSMKVLGRYLGRLHNVGESKKAIHRPKLTLESFGKANLNYLLQKTELPEYLKEGFQQVGDQLFSAIDPLINLVPTHRVHGDCHWGNLINHPDQGLFIVDFDDMVTGPAVQDLWLILPGRDEWSTEKRKHLMEGYEEWRDLPPGSIRLTEPLRALRYLHFAGWLARRWEDPSFPPAFPYFGTEQYWGTLLNDLREQLSLIREQDYYY
jgi:Ser/Thr protein kinase RdoA (MazF antagonist)